MRGGFALFLTILGLIGLATSLPAQVPVRVTLGGGDEATLRMYKFARCVARAKPKVIASVLDRQPTDPAYHRILQHLSQERTSCLPVGSVMMFNDLAVAGGMAEWMLGHRFPGDALGQELTRRAADPAPEPRGALERVSLCVARAAPAQTAALFATTPTTPEEGGAVRALGPSLPGCIAPAQTLRLGKPTLRANLALAAYRIALQSPGAGKN